MADLPITAVCARGAASRWRGGTYIYRLQLQIEHHQKNNDSPWPSATCQPSAGLLWWDAEVFGEGAAAKEVKGMHMADKGFGDGVPQVAA